MSASPSSPFVSGWVPRRELALPNELLHKILLWVLCDSVHSICVSTGDTTWEKNVVEIFHQVSPSFKAISNEIMVKAFDIPRDVRNSDSVLLRTLREIFVYLNVLGARFRHPSEWGNVSFQTIDCSASSFVFAYALYLSCTTLRRNASRSPADVFDTTHKVVFTALSQSQALCERVRPVEMTLLLRENLLDELDLAKHGVVIVQGFHELSGHANSLAVLQPLVDKDGTGPVSAVRSLIHGSLSKIEAVYEVYEATLVKRQMPSEPPIYELPGVLRALRTMSTMNIDEDEYNLRQRIRNIVDRWTIWCPFLNKRPKRQDDHTAV